LIVRFAPIDDVCIHRDYSPAGGADKRSRQQGANRAARCRHEAEKADDVGQDAGRDQKGACDENHHAVHDRWPGYPSASQFRPNVPQRRDTLASRDYGAEDSRDQNQEQGRSSSDPAAHFEQQHELYDRDEREEQEQLRHID
jgi:hypothetical protein